MAAKPRRDRGLLLVALLGVVLVGGGGLATYALVTDDSLLTIGPSMRPTLETEERVDIDDGAYASARPEIGDIVTAQGPQGLSLGVCADPVPRAPCARASADYSAIRVVKRVVGLPGDRIAVTPEGHIVRNGAEAAEPFIRTCAGECGLPVETTVPDGHYFLAGDNRPVSSDSRFWGAVPLEAIDGKVAVR